MMGGMVKGVLGAVGGRLLKIKDARADERGRSSKEIHPGLLARNARIVQKPLLPRGEELG